MTGNAQPYLSFFCSVSNVHPPVLYHKEKDVRDRVSPILGDPQCFSPVVTCCDWKVCSSVLRHWTSSYILTVCSLSSTCLYSDRHVLLIRMFSTLRSVAITVTALTDPRKLSNTTTACDRSPLLPGDAPSFSLLMPYGVQMRTYPLCGTYVVWPVTAFSEWPFFFTCFVIRTEIAHPVATNKRG